MGHPDEPDNTKYEDHMTLSADIIKSLYPGLTEARLQDMGRDAAFDIYLEFLSHNDVWSRTGLIFKGGTAVRKFVCDPANIPPYFIRPRFHSFGFSYTKTPAGAHVHNYST